MPPAASPATPPASDSGSPLPAHDFHNLDSAAGRLKISLQDFVRRYPKSCAFLALAVLGLIAYANALGNTFHFDDNEGIVSNASLRSLANIPAFFTDPIIFRFTERLDWRPILQTTYAIDYAIGGYNSFVFNLTDLLLHIGVAWLVFLVVGEVGRRSPEPFGLDVSAAWIAFAAAALFVVHTANSQTVNYVWARSSLLAALFYLLSFYCHVCGPFGGKAVKPLLWHLGALAAFACGLGSKATAVSLPGMLVAYEFLFLNPAGRNPLSLYLKEPRRLVKYIPTLAVLAGYTVLRAALMPRGTQQLISTSLMIGRRSYLLTQFRAWIYYLKIYLWPHPLVLDYPGFGWSASLWESRVLVSLALIAVIAVGAWRVRHSRPMLSFFTLWFFIALLPEASVISRPDAVTGHRPYLAYAGLSVPAILLGLQLAAWLWQRRKNGNRTPAEFRSACCLTLGVALVLLTGATIRRNLDWRDEETLWSDVIRKDPTNARAHMILGIEYIEREDYAKAQELLDKAVGMSPGNAEAYEHRGNLNLLLGRYDQALSDLTLAIERGRRPFAFIHRGELYRKLGRYDEALKDYESALRLTPQFPDAYYGIAMVYWERKELPQATATCRKLLAIEPDSRRSYICLGSLLMHQEVFGEALKVYYSGVVLFPQNSTLWYGLGTAYEELGLYKEAEGAYARSSSLAREPERKAPSIK